MVDNYCVYLTCYKGNKLPIFYIGSSSFEKIQNGYRGTVTSKKYKKIFKEELKNNFHLFKILIIFSCKTRKEALDKEHYFQSKLNVVKNPLYMNQAVASVNGFFGMDVSGKLNPRFGVQSSFMKSYWEDFKQNSKEKYEELCKKISERSKIKCNFPPSSSPKSINNRKHPDYLKGRSKSADPNNPKSFNNPNHPSYGKGARTANTNRYLRAKKYCFKNIITGIIEYDIRAVDMGKKYNALPQYFRDIGEKKSIIYRKEWILYENRDIN